MAKPTPDLLRKVPLFSALDDGELESLADEFNERRFSAGDSIALEGEGGLMFFVVESGEASVEVQGEEVGKLGRELVRRDRAHRPPAPDGDGQGRERSPDVRAPRLRLPPVRRVPSAGRLEAARGDGGPARSGREPVGLLRKAGIR